MNNIVKISNPMLVGAMALLKKKNSPENRKLFMDELKHAKLLAPAIITPTPEVDENGNRKVSKDSKVNFPMLSAAEGKRYFTVFTDLGEMKNVKAEGYLTVLPIDFKVMAGMLKSTDENCAGIVINPYGESVVLNRKFVDSAVGEEKAAEVQAAETQSDEAKVSDEETQEA